MIPITTRIEEIKKFSANKINIVQMVITGKQDILDRRVSLIIDNQRALELAIHILFNSPYSIVKQKVKELQNLIEGLQ